MYGMSFDCLITYDFILKKLLQLRSTISQIAGKKTGLSRFLSKKGIFEASLNVEDIEI